MRQLLCYNGFMENTYLNTTNSTIKYIGLNNQECKNPVYYCRSKKVFLSQEDVDKKGCMVKPTVDMISTRPCKWIMPVEEFEKYEENRQEVTSSYDRAYRARKRELQK